MTNSENNPYAPVSVESPGVSSADEKLLKDFRSQILALGVLWILFGLLAFGAVAMIFSGALGNPNMAGAEPSLSMIIAIFVGVLALGWLVSGVLSVMRNVTGVYIGLVLSYIALVGNAVQLRVCGIVFLVVIIVQAHRVLGFAKQLKK